LSNPVEQEAARIKLGELFLNFNEFDRCLRSWSVLNGRQYYKYATKPRYRVRVCRFGKTSRSKVQKSVLAGKVDCNIAFGASQQSLDNLLDDAIQCGDFDNNSKSTSSLESEKDDSDSEWDVVDGILVKATLNSDSLGTENSCKLSEGRQAPLLEDRPALMTLCPNSIEGNQGELAQLQRQPNKAKRLRSIVSHHSKWLPRRKMGKNGKQIPENGVCGQLLQIPEG
jgi:hypothetical protein